MQHGLVLSIRGIFVVMTTSAPAISTTVPAWKPGALLGKQRVAVGVVTASIFSALFSIGWESGLYALVWRTFAVTFSGILAYGALERWPASLPDGVARWVLQVVGVALAIPIVTFAIYVASTPVGDPPFWQEPSRLEGSMLFIVPGILFGPWIALAALVRKKDAIARHQALAFSLQRSELEKQALDSRLRLLQAQVTPHFLFNTLANIRELVASGSDRAPDVLESLIRYLQATIPRLDGGTHTVDREMESVRAYLDLMQMRIPDRLQFEISVDEHVLKAECPSTLILTLVENAVRHGIDPAEDGGAIFVFIDLKEGQVHARVEDTGVGLRTTSTGNGTGLASMRERLRLTYGESATLSTSQNTPKGFVSEVTWPVQP